MASAMATSASALSLRPRALAPRRPHRRARASACTLPVALVSYVGPSVLALQGAAAATAVLWAKMMWLSARQGIARFAAGLRPPEDTEDARAGVGSVIPPTEVDQSLLGNPGGPFALSPDVPGVGKQAEALEVEARLTRAIENDLQSNILGLFVVWGGALLTFYPGGVHFALCLAFAALRVAHGIVYTVMHRELPSRARGACWSLGQLCVLIMTVGMLGGALRL